MGVVADKADRPTVWYLFNRRFMCRAPLLATMSIDDIKQFGMPTTGNPVIDQEMSKEWPVRMLSIAEMEDIFNRGYSIRLMKYDDSKTVYEFIRNHLLVWRNFFEMAGNNRVPQETIDELIRLDAFAAAVYEPAKHLFTHEIATSLFSAYRQKRRLGGFMSKNTFIASATQAERKRQQRTDPATANADQKEKEESNYPSLTPAFHKHKVGSMAYDRTIGGIEWK